MKVLWCFLDAMNVVEENISDTEMHEQSCKEAKLASEEDLVEGMFAQEDPVEDDKRPVY